MVRLTPVIRKFSTVTSLMNKPTLANPALFIEKNLINGKWVSAHSGRTFDTEDPATTNNIGTCPEMTVDETREAIQAASEAFKTFRTTTGRQRAKMLQKWLQLINENKDDLAKLVTLENGKRTSEALGEVAYSASFYEWYAEEAPRIYGDVIPSANPYHRIHTVKQPVGVCGIVTPWNFPIAMIARKVAAAVAAGCTTVIKPAAETPHSALAMAYLAAEAGIPDGVINVVTCKDNIAEIGKEICESPLISKVSFTGSTNIGKLLYKQSSSTIKKISLELGGNAPFIVFDDADIDAAVEGALAGKFRGSGQTCICVNRIYVQEGVYDEFAKKFSEKVSGLKVGNGFASETEQGPLINDKAMDKVTRLVEDAVSHNAKVLAGGKPLSELGPYFFEPTVLTDIDRSMAISTEEIFGPVAPIIKFSTEDEAIEHANTTEYGLSAYFFTENNARVHRVSERLEAGMIGVNTGLMTESALPFGGIKQSGFGREGSKYGLDDYLVIKSVVTKL